MPYVYGKDGKIYNLSEEEIVSAINRGKWWNIPSDSKVNYTGPDGKQYSTEFTSENMRRIYGQGGVLEGSEEGRKRWLKKNYSSAEVAGLAVLDSATLGIGRYVANKTGIISTERWNAAEEADPDLYMAAEIGGAVVAGGAGAPVKAGAKVGRLRKALRITPAAQATKIGNRIRGAVAKAVKLGEGTGGRQLAKEALARGAGLGAEGLFYGAGAGLSRVAREDLPLLSEEAIGTIGVSAAIGGGIGIGFGVAPVPLVGVGRKAKRAIGERVGKLLPKDLPAEGNLGPFEVGGGKFTPGKPGKYERFTGAIHSKKPDDIAVFTKGKDSIYAKRAAADYEPILDKSTEAVVRSTDSMQSSISEIEELWRSGTKTKYIEGAGLISPKNIAIAKDEATAITTDFLETFGNLSKDDFQLLFGSGPMAKRIRNHLASFEGKVDDLTPSQFFDHMDNLKKTVGTLRQTTKAKLPSDHRLTGKAEELYESIQKHLEDEVLWGPVAKLQKAFNEPYSGILGRADATRRFRTTQRGPTESFRTTTTADATGTKGLLKNAGDISVEKDLMYLRQDHEAYIKMGEAAKKYLGLGDDALGAIRAHAKTIDDHINRMAKLNPVKRSFDSALSEGLLPTMLSGPAVGYAAGHIVGGYPGGLVGGLIGSAAAPRVKIWADMIGAKVANSQALSGLRQTMDRQVENKVNRLFTSKVVRSVAPIGARAFDSSEYPSRAEMNTKKKKQAYIDTMKELNNLSKPGAIQERLSRTMASLGEHLPEAHFHMAINVSNIIDYLRSTAPVPRNVDAVSLARGITPTPPVSEIDRWLRVVEIANNPLAILDSDYVSREQIDAIRHMYPRLYNEKIKAKLIERLQGGGVPKKGSERMLAYLLGEGSVSIYTPQSIQFYQKSLQPVEIPKSKQTVRTGTMSKNQAALIEGSRVTNFEQNQESQRR